MGTQLFKYNNPEMLSESKILIIEDDRAQRMMIRQMYENLGFKHIHEATNGKDGWEKTIELDPDLVLLDIEMPVMNGFEYCKTARNNPEYNNMVILVQTGLTGLGDKAKIFESGANDYVTKPVDFQELASRSFIHIQSVLNIKKMQEFSNRINHDLQSAKEVLELILPKQQSIEQLKEKYKIDLASEFKSSHEMGGDFWGFDEISKTKLAIYCLDFSGHGIDSSLNAIRLHSILKTKETKSHNPAKLMEWLNNMLTQLLPLGSFATMFYGIIDTKSDTLTYATAACPSPVIFYKSSNLPTVLSGVGYPLGATKNATFTNQKVTFKSGDTLILYSDAITEAEVPGEEMFGEERFIKMLKDISEHKYFDSKEYLNIFLNNFYGIYGNNLKDDMTINIYRRM